MCKTFFTLFLSAFFSICYGQRDSPSATWKKYVSKQNDPAFYLVHPALNAEPGLIKSIQLASLRKFAHDVYIVRKDFIKNLPDSAINFISPANNFWKFSSSSQSLLTRNDQRKFDFILQFSDSSAMNSFVKMNNSKFAGIKQFYSQKLIYVNTTIKEAAKFIDDEYVTFIDVAADRPQEELAITGFDLTANQINLVHRFFPALNGQGEHISLKEQYFDTTDIDLRGRTDPSPLAAPFITNHANMMATIIAGAGNSVWYARGVAPAANVSSSDFATLLPDDNVEYLRGNITLQNHSYGTLIDNNYGLNAVAFDKSSNINQNLLHVFSSGNSGMDTSAAGSYKGIGGFANLTGNFKMAKNVMVVGGVDSFGIVAPQSSRGPTYDGRIKPDIVAFQMNGTSESAALVSGTASLLQQFYKMTRRDSLLPSALARAILVNSATDIDKPGPDYASGFGNLNAYKAIRTLQENHIFSGTVKQDGNQVFSITLPSNTSRIKISLCWNDPAATPEAPVALVNDLDLSIINPSGTKYLPWVLSSAANLDSLGKNAVTGRDSLNNAEQVTIENPAGGAYKIFVNGFKLLSDSQNFYIAYEYDTANFFQWQSPVHTDLINAGQDNTIRWESNVLSPGTLEYSLAPYSKWNLIATNIDLQSAHFSWNTPDTLNRAILRMRSGNSFFYSDTLLITKLANPKVGFICGDTLLVYWNKINGADSYNVYALGNEYLRAIKNVSDTSILLTKEEVSGKFLAVAPLIQKDTGTKSYAFNYELQAAGCYINSFLALASSGTADLTLSTGTLYLVDSISFEMRTDGGFQTIYQAQDINALTYQFNYPLKDGVTYFRARIKLSNGQIVYSPLEALLYVPSGKYLIAPNPAKKSELLHVYSGDATDAVLYVYDASGRRMLSKEISSAHEFVDISRLEAGIYFYSIRKGSVKKAEGKFVVLQ